MKKILVQGYLNHNLGDDLFFKILTERYKNVKWYFVDIDEKHLSPFKNSNIQAISNSEFLFSFYKYDALVNIGGSIFIQKDRWLLQLFKRLFYAFPLKLLRKKVMVMGSNFGPYEGKWFKTLYSFYFKLIDFVSFRDNKSYDLFKSNNKVKKANDIVFSLNKKNMNNSGVGKIVGMSLMDLSWREDLKKYEHSYLESIVNLTGNLLKERYSIKLFSFCKNEGDESVSEYLRKMFNDKRISQVNYNGDMDYFLQQFSQVNAHISLRFHSLILSILYNIPFYPIIYSEKTLNVLKDLGLDQFYTNIKDIHELSAEDIINTADRSPINTDKIIEDSIYHFSFLDKLIGEDRIEK